MSSMFKKRGGLAFKPKAPSARPRAPTTTAAASQPAKPVEQAPPEPPIEQTDQEKLQSTVPEVRESRTSPGAPEGQYGPAESSPPSTTAPSATPAQSTTKNSSGASTQTKSKGTPIGRPATRAADESGPATNLSEVVDEPASEAGPSNHPPPAPLIQNEVDAIAEGERDTVDKTSSTETPVATSEDITPAPEAPAAPAVATRGKRKTAAKPKRTAETDANKHPQKRQRRAAEQPAAAEADESQPAVPRRRRRTAGEGQQTPRKARSVTPEDAESQVVDLQKLKMSDLTKDLHIGKKFSRHDELRERERQARLKAKQQNEGDQGAQEVENEAGDQDTSQANGENGEKPEPTPAASRESAAAAATGPQFRIVDGQIVVDQSSLVMDRHARAAAAQEDMETIEENDFTRLITSSSYMNTSKLKGPNLWTPEETTLFYRALRMFGTDFEMISKMFSGKQRRHIKLKFNREERHNPQMIDAVLKGELTVKMDIDEYKALTGSEFESVESIEAEHRKVEEEYEAERKRAADAQAEAMRKKREELFADEDDGAGGGAAGPGQQKKKKKKKPQKKGKQYDEALHGVETILED